MAANIDIETGLPYGVISGNSVPELMEDIINSGDNLTWKAFREDIVSQIESILDDAGASHAKQIAEDAFDNADFDCYQADEEEYDYVDSKGNKFHMGWLGGAPLIWIIKSDRVERCKVCSPCVPNAGDLDNPDEDGSYALTLPSGYEDCDERDDKGKPILISEMLASGIE